jgi:hypothetical protein
MPELPNGGFFIDDYESAMGIFTKCRECKHWTDHSLLCPAFPGEPGIPIDICSAAFDHTVKHPQQDNDILFEPVEEK